jgi:type II secretory pathway pseudopilin PulG
MPATVPEVNMRKTPGERPAGFTLLELLVVSVLMIGLAMMTAQMWRHFSAQAADIAGRTVAAQELRLALESLSDDLGSVVWATPTPTYGLQIRRKAPGGQGNVTVEYSLSSGRLVRNDLSVGVGVPIANNVSGFVASDVTSSVLQITVCVTTKNVTREATLFWSRT